MFGRIPSLVRFVTDHRVWHELGRLRKLPQQRYGTQLQSLDGLTPLKLIWALLVGQKIVPFGDTYVINSFLPPFPSKAFETLVFRNFQVIEQDKPPYLVVPPLSTHVAITNRCPLKCWHCSKANRPDQQDMSTERWLGVLAELQAWGVSVIAFTGGEPLVHSQLEQMIASVDARSITYIFTSGVGLNATRAQQLKKAGLFGVIVSLDHYEANEHDQMRGYRGAYTHAVRAIEESLNAGMYTMLQMVATKELLHSGGLYQMFELSRELNVHEIRIMAPIPTGQILYAGDNMLLTEGERQRIIEFDKRANGLLNYPKVCSFLRVESIEFFGCGAGSQHSYIDAVGNVYPCDFVPLSFGNVTKQNFRDIWCEVSAFMGGPRSRCFMRDNVEAVRQAANGQLPLPAEASRHLCQHCLPHDTPDYYQQWKQIWQ